MSLFNRTPSDDIRLEVDHVGGAYEVTFFIGSKILWRQAFAAANKARLCMSNISHIILREILFDYGIVFLVDIIDYELYPFPSLQSIVDSINEARATMNDFAKSLNDFQKFIA